MRHEAITKFVLLGMRGFLCFQHDAWRGFCVLLWGPRQVYWPLEVHMPAERLATAYKHMQGSFENPGHNTEPK